METLEKVILVDDYDREIGTGEKHEVHRQGSLHRAFSVIVWDSADRLLLQKRHTSKYHSGGLWTNACCGHPRPGELSLIHISEPTRRATISRMPSSA